MTYTGRHRAPARPRPGARAAVIAGLTLAAPLVGMTSAEAAPAANWGAIAKCESGGQNVHTAIKPSVNTASGYFQITNGTWKGAGGTQFAPTAMQATAGEQLVVAKRIAEARGSLADWKSSQHCWSGARKGSMDFGGSTPAKSVTKVPADTSTRKTVHGTPKSQTDHVKAQTPKVAVTLKTPTGKVAVGRGLPQIPDGYVIRSGDTLGKLATQWHVPGGYRAIAAANHVANPHMIYAGRTLN
jgi:LysM repeat protein